MHACVYIYIWQLSSFRVSTLWFIDLTVTTWHFSEFMPTEKMCKTWKCLKSAIFVHHYNTKMATDVYWACKAILKEFLQKYADTLVQAFCTLHTQTSWHQFNHRIIYIIYIVTSGSPIIMPVLEHECSVWRPTWSVAVVLSHFLYCLCVGFLLKSVACYLLSWDVCQ